MDIEKVLKEYKTKKAFVETTLARIEGYRYALNNPDTWGKEYISPSREIGMPGAPTRNISSPVERLVIDKELDEETIKQWISDDESRVFPIKLEVEQIENAMKCLTKQEKYIVECKYFDNMFWRDIEISFNSHLRQQNYVSYEWLKKLNKEALQKLSPILEPFYNRFKTA